KHQEGVLNYFKFRITNGIVEGMNNKAKSIAQRCYGFRTESNYILALYHGLGKLPEPENVYKFL
ncbi:MAG: ISL3 family transposase, partial [Actinobacteria bacterium]|nr:ISL3 family transposase [Actinomycetota bacterium]